MNSDQRRLRTIELTLTPYQSVLLWLNIACRDTFEDGVRKFPRTALANSILKTVTASMKGQLAEVVERAVLQARREADLLYNVLVDLNATVLSSSRERKREFQFLARYLGAITYSSVDQNFQKDLRATVCAL